MPGAGVAFPAFVKDRRSRIECEMTPYLDSLTFMIPKKYFINPK